MNSDNSTKIIDFYTNSVPESSQTLPNLPIGRIVELYGYYGDYASNTPNSIQFTVQVDVWVKTLAEVDKYYFMLDDVMRENGWQCIYTEQTDDDDLQQAKRIIKRYTTNISLK